MPTLAEIAEGLEADARRAQAEGQHDVAAKLALAAYAALRAWVSTQALPVSLTVQQRVGKLTGVEHTEKTRTELSKRFSKGKTPNLDAARAAGVPSLRALAAKLGCSASFLSQVAAGDRPMPADKAAAFKRLTGKDWQ